MKKATALFLAVIMVISITGCGNLSGRYENTEINEAYVFSGSNYTQHGDDDVVLSKGKYTINGDEIEFVTEDGDEWTLFFSRDGDTITIGGNQFTRK
jgi:uncharacterized lipoprotein YehR (DUF1307 family)